MGGVQRTVKNVWVYQIDPARNLLYLKGQVISSAFCRSSAEVFMLWCACYALSYPPATLLSTLQVPGPQGSFLFVKDSIYKKPDRALLPFPTYFSQEGESEEDLEPLVADLGDIDPFMVAD